MGRSHTQVPKRLTHVSAGASAKTALPLCPHPLTRALETQRQQNRKKRRERRGGKKKGKDQKMKRKALFSVLLQHGDKPGDGNGGKGMTGCGEVVEVLVGMSLNTALPD